MTSQAVEPTQRRVPLTRARVLQTAIARADQGGLEALTMRKLGQELGVEAMALYHHFANKDDLVDGMVDLVFGEIELPVDRARLADGDAPAGDPRARRPSTPSLGDRPHGVAEDPWSGEPATSRRGDRQSPSGRLRHRDGGPRVLAP